MSVYDLLKKIARSIIPKSFLFKHELKFRFFSYLLHKGDLFECNICHSKLKHFIENENSTCPRCGSIARERRLWEIIQTKNLFLKENILDFSPSRSIYREFKKIKGKKYVGTDLSGNFLADKSFDITSIDAKDQSFDLILCYHILEHIIDDQKAMSELYRILNKNGICIIQTPFKVGGIYEDYTKTSPKERLEAFGQDDHVRVYSVEALIARLENVGFKIEKLTFKEQQNNRHGFKQNEVVLICSK
ncbi:MAG: class I SAM-dependent methyltransferase [Flavobacteriia bacterium]|jgi:SAM-dependent methyltransferase